MQHTCNLHSVIALALGRAAPNSMSDSARVHGIHLVTGSAALEDGQVVGINWKAVEFADDTVLFELRDIVLSVVDRKAGQHPVQIGEFLRSSSFIQPVLNEYQVQDGIVPSIKSYKSTGVVPHLKARQEYQVNLEATLLLLLCLVVHRRLLAERGLANLSLRLLLEACSLSGDVVDQMLQAACQTACPLCAEQLDNGVCIHLRQAGLQGERGEHQSPAAWLRDLFVEVFRLRGAGCPAAIRLTKSLVHRTSLIIAETIQGGKFKGDVMKRELLKQPCSKKRMRVDEDYRWQLTNGTVQQNKARSGRQVARVLNDSVDPGVVSKYEEVEMARYMVAASRALQAASGTFSVSHDGVRVGDPAEETLFSVLWSASVDIAVVLPPQALGLLQCVTMSVGSRKSRDTGILKLFIGFPEKGNTFPKIR